MYPVFVAVWTWKLLGKERELEDTTEKLLRQPSHSSEEAVQPRMGLVASSKPGLAMMGRGVTVVRAPVERVLVCVIVVYMYQLRFCD